MKHIAQTEQSPLINEIFRPIIFSKDYRDISFVFKNIEIVLSTLTDQQKAELATYIKEMDFQVMNQLTGNPKLIKVIQKVIRAVSPRLCSNLTIEIENYKVYAHKTLLAAQSEYFRIILSLNLKEWDLSKLASIKIPQGLSSLIEYASVGEFDANNNFEKIFLYANQFKFYELKREIENKLMSFEIAPDLMNNLWNIAEEANAERLLSTIIYRYYNQILFEDQELQKKIYTYCNTKGFLGDLDKLRHATQRGHLFLDAQSQALSLSLPTIEHLPSLLTFLTIDKLYLALKNVTISDLNQLFQQNPKLDQLPLSLNLDCSPMSIEEAWIFAKIIIHHSENVTNLKLSFNQPFESGPIALVQSLLSSNTLHSLDLIGNEIGDHHIQSLIAPLQRNYTLQALDLGWNQIGFKGIQALATVLQQNSPIQELNLQNNRIGDEVVVLARALQINTSLRELNLAWNKIGAEGLRALVTTLIQQNHTLKILNFQGNPIGYFGQQFLDKLQKDKPYLTIKINKTY